MYCSEIMTSYSVPQSQSAILPYLSISQNSNLLDVIFIHVTSLSVLAINNGVINLTVKLQSVSSFDHSYAYDESTMVIDIHLVNPCFSTTINSQTIVFPSEVRKNSAIVDVPFARFIDTVSDQFSDVYGDGSNSDICAPQAYQVFEVDANTGARLDSSSYLSLQGQHIVFNPISSLAYGTHQFVLAVNLTNYNVTHQEVMRFQLLQCQLDSIMIVQPSVTDYSFFINMNSTFSSIPMPQVLKSPSNCD